MAVRPIVVTAVAAVATIAGALGVVVGGEQALAGARTASNNHDIVQSRLWPALLLLVSAGLVWLFALLGTRLVQRIGRETGRSRRPARVVAAAFLATSWLTISLAPFTWPVHLVSSAQVRISGARGENGRCVSVPNGSEVWSVDADFPAQYLRLSPAGGSVEALAMGNPANAHLITQYYVLVFPVSADRSNSRMTITELGPGGTNGRALADSSDADVSVVHWTCDAWHEVRIPTTQFRR